MNRQLVTLRKVVNYKNRTSLLVPPTIQYPQKLYLACNQTKIHLSWKPKSIKPPRDLSWVECQKKNKHPRSDDIKRKSEVTTINFSAWIRFEKTVRQKGSNDSSVMSCFNSCLLMDRDSWFVSSSFCCFFRCLQLLLLLLLLLLSLFTGAE